MASFVADASGKREQNKARNRAEILEAARRVFVEIGYDAATVRDIVGRTELAPGTFYNYFPDKRSVLLAIADEASARGARHVREARAQAVSLEDFVQRSFRAYFEFIAGDRTLFALMRRNSATLRTLDIDESGFASGLSDLRADLRRTLDAQTLAWLPIDYLVRALGAVAFEIGAEMVGRDPPDIDGASKFASDLCLGGLQRMKRRAQPRDVASKGTRKGKT